MTKDGMMSHLKQGMPGRNVDNELKTVAFLIKVRLPSSG